METSPLLPPGREPVAGATSYAAPPVDDLDALLSQPTNYTPPPPAAAADGTPPPPDGPAVDPADFEPSDPLTEPMGGAEPEPVKNRAFFTRQARQFVRTFDVAQKSILSSVVLPKTILEPGDRELVTEYKTRVRTAAKSKQLDVPTRGDALWDALQRYERLDQAIGELPLTADEKADLVAPLADVLEKHQKNALSPEWALVVAVCLVMLPRLESVFPKLFSALQK